MLGGAGGALGLHSVRIRGVSRLWIRLPVFITSSCAGTEGGHIIPIRGLSVTRPGRPPHTSCGRTGPQHASAPEGASRGKTHSIFPHTRLTDGACPEVRAEVQTGVFCEAVLSLVTETLVCRVTVTVAVAVAEVTVFLRYKPNCYPELPSIHSSKS